MIGHAELSSGARFGDWLMHYLSEPDHALMLLALGALVVAAFLALRGSIEDDSQ